MTTHNRPSGGLAVTVGFEESRATLSVRGKVDHLTARELGTLFDAVASSGYSSVVLDLTELDLLDHAGLQVITHASARLVASGGELSIRSPLAHPTPTIEITMLSSLVGLVLPESDDQSVAAVIGAATPVDPALRDRLRRRVSAIPADDDVVDGTLRLVVNLARATVGGAHGVSVSLRRHGRLGTVAASDQTVLDMDASQYATNEGPCVDASIEGRRFLAESLDAETRWPAFIPKARALGINAILSSPLLAEERPVGALNIYSRVAPAFGPPEQALASLFASEASIILADASVDVTTDQIARRLGEAQRIRHVISLAQGVIMEREGLGAEGAYTYLRNDSQRTSRPLRDCAEEILADPPGRPPRDWAGPQRDGHV